MAKVRLPTTSTGRYPTRPARAPVERLSAATTSGPGVMARPALRMEYSHTVVRNSTLARSMAKKPTA